MGGVLQRGYGRRRRSSLLAVARRGTLGCVLLDGVNHIAWISKDIARLGRFYAQVFDAEVGQTMDHGPGETMTMIKIGPHTELNIFTIEGNTEVDRQTPMWGRGRIDHVGLAAASTEAFATIRQRLIDSGASDGTVNRFGTTQSIFFRDPDGLEGEVLLPVEAV
jgi:catechol 2,3-dioxygenase-like lactoylglutathione lyase family enzyme